MISTIHNSKVCVDPHVSSVEYFEKLHHLAFVILSSNNGIFSYREVLVGFIASRDFTIHFPFG